MHWIVVLLDVCGCSMGHNKFPTMWDDKICLDLAEVFPLLEEWWLWICRLSLLGFSSIVCPRPFKKKQKNKTQSRITLLVNLGPDPSSHKPSPTSWIFFLACIVSLLKHSIWAQIMVHCKHSISTNEKESVGGKLEMSCEVSGQKERCGNN